MLANQTGEGGNPAFKIYDVDPDTFEIMDVKVYTSKFIVSFTAQTLIWSKANMSDPNFQTTRK